MSGESYIYTYYQQIKDGSIVVGQYIRLLYEYIIAGLESKAFFFDAKKANKAVEWIESHAFHTEGPLAPGPFKLELWEKAFLSCVFGLVDEKGLRQFREVLLLVGRKSGKSVLAAGIAKYNWWIDGGYGAKVYTIAPKLDQADIIYNNIWQMCLLDPEWQKRKADLEAAKKAKEFGDDPELARHRMTDLYLPANNGTVKKIAFSAKKSDGFNPSLCICDEIAAWEGDKGLKQYEVMKSGMGARPEGLLLSCTTANYVNDSIYDELMKRSTAFLHGNSKEKKLLPFLYMVDDPEKWNDINELRKANPNLGVSVPVDFMLEEIAVAEGSLSKKAEFLCKYCNIKQNSSQAWFEAQDVEKCFGAPLGFETFKGHYCVVGIDLSQTTDLTCCLFVVEKEGKLNVLAKFFMPEGKIDEATARDGLPYRIYVQRGLLQPSGENFVDYEDCKRWITETVNKYRLYPRRVGYDRYSAQYLVNDLKAFGLFCDDVFQGENLTPIINEVDGLMRDHRFNFGDNDLMKVHLLNAALKQNNETNRRRLIKTGQTARIDGTAALLDAICMRQKWAAEDSYFLKNEGK